MPPGAQLADNVVGLPDKSKVSAFELTVKERGVHHRERSASSLDSQVSRAIIRTVPEQRALLTAPQLGSRMPPLHCWIATRREIPLITGNETSSLGQVVGKPETMRLLVKNRLLTN